MTHVRPLLKCVRFLASRICFIYHEIILINKYTSTLSSFIIHKKRDKELKSHGKCSQLHIISQFIIVTFHFLNNLTLKKNKDKKQIVVYNTQLRVAFGMLLVHDLDPITRIRFGIAIPMVHGNPDLRVHTFFPPWRTRFSINSFRFES